MEKIKNVSVPMFKIDFDRISFYEVNTFSGNFSKNSVEQAQIVSEQDREEVNDFNNRQHDGILSTTARANLLRAIGRFAFFTDRVNKEKALKKLKGKRSLKFVTLTLSSPQIHSDVEIKKKCLNQFLIEMREKYKMKHYVWKAEKQENGNLHFHIIIDVYINYQDIRYTWNRCQNSLGYVDRFRERMKKLGLNGYCEIMKITQPDTSIVKFKERYLKGLLADFRQPPSTEIRQVLKVRNARAYFGKYFSKPSKIEPGFGRIWFASRSLTLDTSLRASYHGLKGSFHELLETHFMDKKVIYDYAVVFWVSYTEIEKVIKHRWLNWYSEVLNKEMLNFY